MTTMERLKKEDPEAAKRLTRACVVFPPVLPRCAIAAMAQIARAARVRLPDCDEGEECNHLRLPQDYGQKFKPGTNLGQVIYAIEVDAGMVDQQAQAALMRAASGL